MKCDPHFVSLLREIHGERKKRAASHGAIHGEAPWAKCLLFVHSSELPTVLLLSDCNL